MEHHNNNPILIKHLLSLIVFLFGLSTYHPAQAGSWEGKVLKYEFSKYLDIELPGYYRFRYTQLDELPLSEIPSGARAGERQQLDSIHYTEHRLRLEPKVLLLKKLSFHSQIDILTGMLSGDRTNREILWMADPEQRWNDLDGTDMSDFSEVHFKRYYGRWESPVGLLQVGRQGSQWGLGMIANNAEGFANDFGDAYYGDNVDRVIFGTKPYSIFRVILGRDKPAKDPVTIAFAYDWNVARDSKSKRGREKLAALNAIPDISSSASASDINDDVHQYIGAIRVETAPFEGGFYIVRRMMDHPDILLPAASRPDKEFLRAWVFDFYGKLQLKPEVLKGTEIFIEGEFARIIGKTNLTVSKIESQPLTDPFPESDVSQMGWLMRAGARHSWIEARIEGGYASGDSNPFDNQVKSFKFHPDYNTGMILFEDLLAGVSAASSFNAINRFEQAGPVKTLGADLLPTNGAITNTFYVNATMIATLLQETLSVVFSVLWAQAATDFVDPTMDGLFGGGAGTVNPLGGPATNHTYGFETDLGASYTWKQPYYDVIIGLQYGHFFPGNAFENAQGNRIDDIDKIQLRLSLVW